MRSLRALSDTSPDYVEERRFRKRDISHTSTTRPMNSTSARRLQAFVATVATLSLAGAAAAQETLSAAQRARIDSAVVAVLDSTGTPSASIAAVWHGRIAYEKAYWNARINPARAATPQSRYSIGSVSKQFTATVILLLAEEHRLSLDDKVAKWLPDLTRANLGAPTEFVQTAHNLRGGMTFRAFRIRAGGKTLELTMRTMPNGKIEQYLVDRAG